MKPSDDLHKLIKSLTKAEKIFFKKYSKRHVLGNGNKYVMLFDVIEEQEKNYDENLVRERFKGDRFINQIHVAKNYLYDLILKTLSIMHSEKEIDFVLFEFLKKIKLLIDKNLINSALKLIKKAKIIAEENYNYSGLYQLIELEALITARKYTREAYDELRQLVLKKDAVMEELTNTSYYKSYNLILNLISARWSYSKNPGDLEIIEKILNLPKIKNEHYASGFASKYEVYGIKLRAYRFLLEDEKSLYYRKKVVELMEQYPESIEKFPERYTARLHDVIIFLLGTDTGKKHSYNVEDYFIKLKNYKDIVLKSKKNAVTKALSWQAYYQLRIGYYYSQLNRNGFNSIMTEINRDIEFHKDNLRERYLFDLYLYIINAYFEFKEYEESLKWLSKYMNHKNADKFEELYHTMIMFSIILHYELGNYEYAESQINNTKRYYKKEEKLYESERVILKFMKQLLSATNEDTLRIFKDLSLELELLSGKESEKRFLNAFDFKRWVGKKLGNITT